LDLQQCVEHVYCKLYQYTNSVSEKFKYFVTLCQNRISNNKCDAIDIWRKIYDKNSNVIYDLETTPRLYDQITLDDLVRNLDRKKKLNF
ncbi:hypothetical protein ALC53_07184, partial [Atta colombica]